MPILLPYIKERVDERRVRAGIESFRASYGKRAAKYTVPKVHAHGEQPLAHARGSVPSHDRKGVVQRGYVSELLKLRTKGYAVHSGEVTLSLGPDALALPFSAL